MNRRRSTRVDLVLPIVLSGRDASGETYREETQTATVNLHGAKVATSRNVLVGMQVSIENPLTGAVEKAVCVRVFDEPSTDSMHYIATQLVRPGNIWGIEDPPEDWTAVAESMLGKKKASSRPAWPSTAEPAGSAPAMPILESQAVTAEQQASNLTESILEVFRQQIQILADVTLQNFETRLKELEAESAARIRDGAKESLDAIRQESTTQMAVTRAEAIAVAERQIRERVAEILAPLTGIGSALSPDKHADSLTRK